MRHECRYASPEEFAEGLASHLALRLSEDLAQRSEASLIVSGGRTPRAMFERLAEKELQWQRVNITLADERLVPLDHVDSNARLVREHLLKGKAGAANFFPLWSGKGDAVNSAQHAIAHLARPFSSVVLGMGDDGHTASLFPGMPGLRHALDAKDKATVIAVAALAGREARLSLTLRTLLETAEIVVAFEGSAKRAVFESALAEGPIEKLPVRAILRQTKAPVDVYWSA